MESRKCLTDYDDQYNRLRSYGYGETFMKNEGVIGDILRDINRTFPTHVLFRSSGGMGQIMLENVLRSLNEYFPDIGYCQVGPRRLWDAGDELRGGRGDSGNHGPARVGLQRGRVEAGVDCAAHDDVGLERGRHADCRSRRWSGGRSRWW